jgi:peptidoglycan/LPS O-acetylase OafA/YrhL
MYLGHLWVIGLVLPPLLRVVTPETGTGTVSGIVIVVLMIALSTAVAAVTFVLVEHPFLVMRGHVMRPRAQGIIATPGATAAEEPSKESAPDPIPAPSSVVA